MIKKIIFINIITIVLILCIVEFLSFQTCKNKIERQINLCSAIEQCRSDFEVTYTKAKKFNYYDMIKPCLTRVYKGNKKGGIVTIGCSYTYGMLLEEPQIFAYKLNKLTGRTTYNRGVCGSGPQMVYRQLSDKNFKNEVPEADYIIYTFLYDHLGRQNRRLLSIISSVLLNNYKITNNELTEIKRPFWFLYSLFSAKIIAEYGESKGWANYNKTYKLFLKTMEESVKAMKTNYPNAKFILMEFPCPIESQKDYKKGSFELSTEQIKDIEKLGIIYINAKELVGNKILDIEKYRMYDGDHPNERVWDEIVPALAKKLNL